MSDEHVFFPRSVVLSHHHEHEVGIYRIVVQHLTDHLLHTRIPNEHFKPEDAKDNEYYDIAPHFPVIQSYTIEEGTEDFVWSDEDPRWQGKTDEEIAALQRADVKQAIFARNARFKEEIEKLETDRHDMPGVGEEL